MKHVFTPVIIALASVSAFAQSKLPYDSINHVVVYSQSFKLGTKVTQEEVFASAQSWLGDAAKFTNKNADPPTDTVKAKKNKKKIETEELFANPHPLQMLDPAGGKVLGMGIVKYYGGNNSIKLLYLKYDVAIKITAATATVSVSNFHYFHYNPGSYKQVPLYNFSGGTPCEEVGTIEALIGCENFHDEFKNLTVYCNKAVYGHMGDFKELLKQKKYLYDPKTATTAKATTKTTTKTAAKTPAKAAAKPVAKKK